MLELSKKTFIASILFVDIVSYSKWSVEKQLDIKNHLNQSIAHAIKDIPEAERILLDTGDGAALCFLSSPEEALEVALSLRKQTTDPEYAMEDGYQLRMGINLGPVRVIKDINDQRNIIGDGINAAQRVLSFAASNRILVSRAFHDITSYLTSRNMELFRYHGAHKDKHAREYEVYEVIPRDGAGVPPSAPDSLPATQLKIPSSPAAQHPFALPQASLKTMPEPSEEYLRLVEQKYACYVGPIAHILVRRILKNAASLGEVRDKLLELITDEQDKAEFRQFFDHRPNSPTRAENLPPPAPMEIMPGNEDSPPLPDWPAATLDALAEKLMRFIGPIAKVLVKRESKNTLDLDALRRRLAKHIEAPDDREEFLRS